MSKSQPAPFEKSLFKKPLFYYKKRSKIPKSGKNMEKIYKIFFLSFLESRHHNLRQYHKKNLKFFHSLTFTEVLVWSAFYSKTAVFFRLFSQRAGWDLLIFAPHVVQTFPEPATRSDLMHIFVKGYLGKKYSVRTRTMHGAPRRIAGFVEGRGARAKQSKARHRASDNSLAITARHSSLKRQISTHRETFLVK